MERSKVATIAAIVGVLGLADALLGPILIHAGVLAPIGGFYLFAAGAVLGGLMALILGAVGMFQTRASKGLAGRERAKLGLGLGALLVLVLVGSAGSGASYPPIHDVTTNIADPPQFSEGVRRAPDRANGVKYPDGGSDVPAQQEAAFPDLRTIALPLPPAMAFERALAAAEDLGWNVTTANRETGIIEANDVTTVFKFVDDVVVRIRAAGSGSSVDLRSNSRVGGGDLGANAKRILAFQKRLGGA